MRLLLLSVLIMAVINAAFCFARIEWPKESYSCSPWKGRCHVSDDCCRHLECLPYLAKCVPKTGIIVPGEDKRPIGGGPFPPGYPNN